MKIINPIIRTKDKLPKGKITVRWVKARNVRQVYVAGRYLYGASGDTAEDALDALESTYDAPEGYRASVNFAD